MFTDGHAGYPPATAAACIQLLDHYQVPLQGKHVVVVGRSLVVGKPVSMMLLRRNASVTICHSKTENLADIMRSADVVICATGRARTFGAQFFGPGQTVLDVGINFDTNDWFAFDVKSGADDYGEYLASTGSRDAWSRTQTSTTSPSTARPGSTAS